MTFETALDAIEPRRWAVSDLDTYGLDDEDLRHEWRDIGEDE